MRCLLFCALVACGSDETGATDPGSDWGAPEGGVVSLSTEDGVSLEADYYPVDSEGAPGVILVHMIPPNATRADWPSGFIRQLGEAGMAVIAIDRRGAGGSGGNPVDAYEGELGKWDVRAAVDRLQADGYGEFAVVGASNGTTSTIDYAVWADAHGEPTPAAVGFLTGGTYTENQNAMSAVPELPAFFAYSTAEAAWSNNQKGSQSGWDFFEYPNGDHGTRLFTSGDKAQFRDDLLAWLDEKL